ncbi:hypothetical protein RS130_22675 [Paraglaciecola aquimarina]|uniref:PEP-CTERM protein-sorting domain-containing protein n=1 Tax=Paraglaciecola aquimarina TaxID=1235557 RepID=A0ABU3T277_9ALTE|nr:hypothetical protein [Paraglaciecola aquimarina]MDU0356318.1 hypothetical protein [Paraglaciecola aquimarina]
MQLQGTYQKMLTTVCLLIALALSNASYAGLINSDFSDGLNGWDQEFNYYSYVDDQEYYFEPIGNLADFTDNYIIGANSVVLTTSADADNDYFGFYLFQGFIVDNNAFELSLEVNSIADDPSAAFVTLVDDKGDLIHDFINGGLTFDMSSLAGSLVSLEMGIEDIDFVLNESLTVSNISISTRSVPEPSTFVLLSLALLALRHQSKNVTAAGKAKPELCQSVLIQQSIDFEKIGEHIWLLPVTHNYF